MGIFSQNVYAVLSRDVINALLSVKLSGLKMGQCNWFNICFMFVSSSKFIWFILFVWYLFRIFFSLYIYSILTIFFIFDSSCICIVFFFLNILQYMFFLCVHCLFPPVYLLWCPVIMFRFWVQTLNSYLFSQLRLIFVLLIPFAICLASVAQRATRMKRKVTRRVQIRCIWYLSREPW